MKQMLRKEWKRIICLAVLAVLAVAGAAAEGAGEMDPAYVPVMELYREGLSGNEEVILSGNADFNLSAWQGCMDSGVAPTEALGYTLKDLDGDGAPELLIADATAEQMLEGIVFDVWTVRDGKAVLLRRGWDRWRLYLTGQNSDGTWGFYQEGSSGATNSVYELGTFRGGEAVTEHTLAFEAENENPWLLDSAAIDEETAYTTIDDWSARVVPAEGLALFASLPAPEQAETGSEGGAHE